MDDYRRHAISKLKFAVTEYIRLIYFNPNFPQNHTLLYTNKKYNTVKVHTGKIWESTFFNKIIDRLVILCEEDLDAFAESDTSKTKENWGKYYEIMDGDKNARVEIKDMIKMMCHDKNKMINTKMMKF